MPVEIKFGQMEIQTGDFAILVLKSVTQGNHNFQAKKNEWFM